MKQHHVAFLIPGIDRIGGAERQVITLAKGLVHRGWRATTVALSGDGGSAARELLSRGVNFVSLRMRKGIADPWGWTMFRRWIEDEAPDILHGHLPHATWMARGVRLVAPVRVVVDTIHTSATGKTSRRFGYDLTGWLSDRVTAVSEAAAEACVQAGMIRPERVTVLPNGVDVQEWQPDAAVRARVRRDLGVGDNDFVWFTAGRLERVKDYPTMILAFMGLPESARLVIAGAGSQADALHKLVGALELQKRVHFVGFQPDVLPWMQAADGFVLSSLWEGLPVCLLEASACEVPCVATSVPGTREVVIDGTTGFLSRPDHPSGLRKAMVRLMETPPESRRAMGMHARLRVETQFSLSWVLDRWESVYRELLEVNPNPRRWARSVSGPGVTAAIDDGTSRGENAASRAR